MANVPGFVLGRDLLYCFVAPVAVATDGTFVIPTLVSGYNMSGYVDSVRLSDSPSLAMIQSIDVDTANYEREYEDFTCTLGEIMARRGMNGGRYPVLMQAAVASDLIVVQYAVRSSQDPYGGNPVNPSIVTVVGQRGDFGTGVQSFGKNPNDLVIRPKTWNNMNSNPLTVGNVSGILRPFWVVQ